MADDTVGATGIYNYGRHVLRQGTRQKVETDGTQTDFKVFIYAGELYYDTTDGHLWLSDGASIRKIDPRGMVVHNGDVVTHNGEVVMH